MPVKYNNYSSALRAGEAAARDMGHATDGAVRYDTPIRVEFCRACKYCGEEYWINRYADHYELIVGTGMMHAPCAGPQD